MGLDDRQFEAYLDELHVITILLPKSYQNGISNHFYLIEDGIRHELQIAEIISLGANIKYICHYKSEVQFGETSWIVDEHGGVTDLQIGSVIRTPEFDQRFYYEGNDLGVTYTPQRISLKLWAPTATSVRVKLLSPNQDSAEEYVMNRNKKGVWFIERKGDYELYHYSFLICINQSWREVIDPYAVSATANGKMGVIVNLEKTRMAKPNPPSLKHPTDAIIYETHIRDFTIHPASGASQKGLYLGAQEAGTCGEDGLPTGITYVYELGVTHVEFLPFHDFEGIDELGDKEDYNWGYNPLHFNVPEGSYSSNAKDPYARIIELKKMIQSIQTLGLRVIMDVVYNHVYIREQSSFEKILPGYYFRHDHHGMPSNGTGVGNDIASERLMVRKFILDSIRFWMTEYHVDGFRFDLMGIIDIETMNQVRKLVDEMDDTAIILGEGWDLNTPISPDDKANIRNQKNLPRIAQFNDWFRDSIKGSTFNLYDRGYCFGNDHYHEAAMQVLAGSVGIEKPTQGIFTEPIQTVNYVESHDNHTLWDKLSCCYQNSEYAMIEKRHRLATSMVVLAQGIPFLHSGQEFFRSKNGVGNSYRSPDEVNWLDWSKKVQHQDNVDYLKGLIKIRKSHQAFRFPTAKEIRQHSSFLTLEKPLIGYFLKDVGQYGLWNHIVVLINPMNDYIGIQLPISGEWHVLANGTASSPVPIGETSHIRYFIEPISVAVLVK
ncbi:type I pullulanase [Bacillus sp. DNRA2]|uniref:type I pullulanase n=1 Tax=Bacillus sp. DNRA2 TaxID=2723053 RepID=UPI00145E7A6D|nr:type I pullulanase [Bacillus sp. DNRA2]NMD72736.1 type I pullulanase [Bacillus sp. DNRA2]